jgi:hypothetical protein
MVYPQRLRIVIGAPAQKDVRAYPSLLTGKPSSDIHIPAYQGREEGRRL